MLDQTELELKSNLTLGVLESNALEIKNFVTNRLKEYTPEKYAGRADEAKADRAVLNAAEKQLNAKRLELERAYMQPFESFKAVISDTCKEIKAAAAQLDAIVKGEEEKEKAAKFAQIEEYWTSTGFDLFDMEEIFNSKWLNKTAKIKDVFAEIDAIQKKTLDELKIIEQFAAEDQPLIKAEYLNTHNITAAVDKANQLKANRERLAREAAAREEVEKREALQQQAADIKTEKQANAGAALVSEIIPEAREERGTIALEFCGTMQQLTELKEVMTRIGITYKKLKTAGNGVYTLEG